MSSNTVHWLLYVKAEFSFDDLTNQHRQVIVEGAMIFGRTILQPFPFYFLNRMSSMTSLFRPLLSSLLCCVIAVGQLPALLHVASCHGHAHCQRVDAEKDSSDICSHGCHHHASDNSARGAKDHVDQNEESPAVPLHDSEHCAICHSLANPVGLVWNFELPQVQDCLHAIASFCADRLPVEASITIPQPRGPPVVA